MSDSLSINPQQPSDLANGSYPWWVKAIATFGVPSAIAMFLVWNLTTGQNTAMAQISTTLQEHSKTTAAMSTDVHNELQISNARIETYLRLMCVNSAKTVQDRTTCLSVR